ncbi:LacI family transcriptional regulator [Mycetocola tolaasinivorans]|uniref:LacI family transcriptional regulator n=1 Tax=Mycetocola tolaasinivorans TaxID=76635 RepID=A0A3L7AAW9_9MICO|nr:LacI family DNA-binding transcriptional regulator [Mycetocola tolaasinivorans]RLP76960.1 LacI family transcriptional regulator [Mycetocola tolaasinivorans]
MVGPAQSPVTLEAVAALSGVSRSTVSRVINGSTAVSPATLEAVESAIAQLSYVPNQAARSLVRRQTRAIALVVPEDTSRFFGDPFFATVVSGVHHKLTEAGYVLNIFIASDTAGDRTTAYLRGGNVDGAIIISHHSGDEFVNRIADSLPVVFGGRPNRTHDTSEDYFVDIDNTEGGRMATRYLIGRGATRIAAISGPQDMPAGRDRLTGYRQELTAAGLPESLVEEGDFSERGGELAMERLLARGEFDALFVASDLMARGALRALSRAGIRVPEDVPLVGFDDSSVATQVSPTLTTVRQPSALQGEMIAQRLLEILAGESPEKGTVVPAELVIRESA